MLTSSARTGASMAVAAMLCVQLGLAVVLVFVGLKMTLSDLYTIPVYLSLLVIVGILAASVGASLLRPERPGRPVHSEGGT